jgi:ribosomal protein S7
MRNGKKPQAEKAFILAFFRFKTQYLIKAPYLLLFRALLFYRPLMGFSKKRISRQFKPVPMPLSTHRQMVVVST